MKIAKKMTASSLCAAIILLTACSDTNNNFTNNGSPFDGTLFDRGSSTGESSSADSGSSGSSSGETTSKPENSSAPESKPESSSSTSSGGGNSTPVPDELTDEDDTLTIVSWSTNEDVELLIDFYCEETGTDRSKIIWKKLGETSTDSRDIYMNYLNGDNDADLLFCDVEWVTKYTESFLTIPLSELGISASQYPDAYPYTLAVGTNSRGELKAATWQATPGCFVYRADLAKKYLGVNSPAEMQKKVKDWDTFKATAAEVYNKSSGAAVLQSTEGGLWQVRQAALSKPWVVNGKFSMDPVAEDFYDMAKEFADKHYMGSYEQWTAEWYNSVYEGAALGDFVPTWGLKGGPGSILYNFAAGVSGSDYYYEPNDSADNTILSVCEGPQGWFWGGTYICASNKINTKKTAADFIKFFTQNADVMKKYAEKNGDFMNNSKVMSNVKFNNPILIGGQNQFEILVEKSKSIDLDGKLSQYDSDIKNYFNQSVWNYINGKYSSKADAVKGFKQDIAKYIIDITVE